MKHRDAGLSLGSNVNGHPKPLHDGSPEDFACLASFKLEDQVFAVVPVGTTEKPARTKPRPRSFRGCKVVGELWIEDRLHFIVPTTEEHAEQSCTDISSLLTKRETQIIMLVAEGYVNKQIADKLHISEWTVSTHMRRIFAKLGVDSRAAMVFRCTKQLEQIQGQAETSFRS